MGTTGTAPGRQLDAALLGEIYDQHGAAVYGLAHWITGDAQVAARLTAETFGGLRFLDATGAVPGVRGCVLTDVHRRAVAWTREHNPLAASHASLPFDGFSQLDDDEQTVITEAHFGGKTYDAVAEMLGIECEDVARLMQHALRRLGTGSAAEVPLTGRPRTA